MSLARLTLPFFVAILAPGALLAAEEPPLQSGLVTEVETPSTVDGGPASEGASTAPHGEGAASPTSNPPDANVDDDESAVAARPEPGEGANVVPSSTPADTAADDEKAMRRVAVYDFKADGVDERSARLITEATVTEVRKLIGLSVVGLDEIRAMLDHEAARQSLGCGDESCLSELADALDVDEIVTGTLTRQGDEHVFGLRRIDHRAASVKGSIALRFPAASGEEFLVAIGPAIAELFPELALRAGAKRGVPDDLLRKLNPPPLPLWVFVGGAVSEATVVVLTGAAAALFLFAQNDYRTYATRGTAETIQGSVLQEKSRTLFVSAIAANVMLGVVVVHSAALGVVALFVDWRGDGDSE